MKFADLVARLDDPDWAQCRSRELYDDFTGPELSDIWDRSRLEERAIEFQSEIVREGESALKITIQQGDRIEGITERDELMEKLEYGPLENEACRYSFSMYIPEDFPIVPTRLVLAQWKQTNFHESPVDNPVLALRYVNGELFLTLQTSEGKETIFSTTDDIQGKWIDYDFNVKFSRTDGFVQMQMDGKQVVDQRGVTAYSEEFNYPEPGHFYFKMGLYRDEMSEPMTVYVDEFRKTPID